MSGPCEDTLPADDPDAVARAVDRAAAGSVVRLIRGGRPVAHVSPPDPDAVFRPMLSELAACAAEISQAHPDPADLERWQRAERLHQRWRTTGELPTAVHYAAELRKFAAFAEPEIAEQARAMVEADAEALDAYPLPVG